MREARRHGAGAGGEENATGSGPSKRTANATAAAGAIEPLEVVDEHEDGRCSAQAASNASLRRNRNRSADAGAVTSRAPSARRLCLRYVGARCGSG